MSALDKILRRDRDNLVFKVYS